MAGDGAFLKLSGMIAHCLTVSCGGHPACRRADASLFGLAQVVLLAVNTANSDTLQSITIQLTASSTTAAFVL